MMPQVALRHVESIEQAKQTLYDVQARRVLVVIDEQSCDLATAEPLITQARWVNNRVLVITSGAHTEPLVKLADIDGVLVLDEASVAEHFARGGLRDFLSV